MSCSRLVAIVAVCAAACGGSGQGQRVHKPGDDYLKAIWIEGNKAVPDNVLIRGLALHRTQQAGRAIDEYQLGVDIERITGVYQKLGYFAVTVTPRIDRNGDATTLILTVNEGARATARVELTGLPPELSAEKARGLIKVRDGAPFDYTQFDEGKQALLELIDNAGYAHAHLEASVLADRANARATLRYAIDSGPRVTFGAIEIAGVTGDLAQAARNRLTFATGEAYSAKQIAKTQDAIYGIGRFSSVRIDVDRTAIGAAVPVKVALVESARWETRLGGGFGLDPLTYNARLRAVLTHAGWPTPLTTLGGEFRPAYTVLRDNCDFYELWACDYQPRIRLLGTLTQQDFLRPDLKGEIEGGLDYLALEPYTMTGARLRLGLSMPLGTPRIQARLGWQLGGYDFTDVHPAIDAATAERLGIDHPERVGAFTEAIVLDLRDDQVSPRFGAYAEMRVAQGGRYAASAYDYVQLTPELRGYVPIGGAVLAAHVRVGAILGDVPPTERYFAGGASSHRGFSERRLSPEAVGVDAEGKPILDAEGKPIVDDKGNPLRVVIGGAGMIETGVELRTRFEPWSIKAGGVVFIDGGDVTETPGDLDVGNLHWAVGAGLRFFYLPIGPIRIELARRVNRYGAGEPDRGTPWTLSFSVGEAY